MANREHSRLGPGGGGVRPGRVSSRPGFPTSSTEATESVGAGKMLILFLGGVCGVGVGLARGGHLANLGNLRFRAPLLPCLALGVQAAAGLLVPGQRFAAITTSYAVVAIWLALNAARRVGAIRAGMAIVTVGWLLNGLPITLNGGMPVSRHGLDGVGAPATISVTEGHLFKHVPAGRDTRFGLLGDVIPVQPLRAVISVGDVVMAVGLTMILVAAMGRRPRADRSPPFRHLPARISDGCSAFSSSG